MEKKELIKLYLQNVDKMFGYVNMNAYIDERLKKYTKYCQSKKPEEQIIIWLKLLHENFGKKIVYLGSYLALQEKDMSYLNNAFNSAVTWGQLTITNSGCDHSIHAWNILPHIFCANRFRDIEKIFPKENGLSKNGLKSACSITNLVMYLYYQEPMWKQYVIDESKEFLQNKHTAEEKAVINGFLALIEKNWEKFSLELANLCKAHRKSKDYGENPFTRKISFFAFGLYNFARYLYREEVKNITLPQNEFLFEDFRIYQESTSCQIGQPFCIFEEPLLLLNDFEKIDLPIMYLTAGKKRVLDIENYRQEVVKKIQALHSNQSS